MLAGSSEDRKKLELDSVPYSARVASEKGWAPSIALGAFNAARTGKRLDALDVQGLKGMGSGVAAR